MLLFPAVLMKITPRVGSASLQPTAPLKMYNYTMQREDEKNKQEVMSIHNNSHHCANVISSLYLRADDTVT